MDFGRKYRVGNYVVVKKVRSLSRNELRELRGQAGIPADVQKHLQRGGLPYVYVGTVSGSWSMTWACGLQVYVMFDRMLPRAVAQQEDPQEGFDGLTVADFAHWLNMWYTDTNVIGDGEYQKDKAMAFKAFMDRVSMPRTETPKEKAADDKVLEEVKADDEARATIVDMAGHMEAMNGDPSVMTEKGGDV